jgi:hypothetical protein
MKPMPGPGLQVANAPQPFVDQPLLQDVPPEAQRFVQVYQQVGRPRILVFVNRTLEGQIIGTEMAPANPGQPPAAGAGAQGEYLQPGQYDEVAAKTIDYGMMETLLTDWMSAGNQVAVVSPTIAKKPLTEQQQKDLAAGKQQVMQELAAQLDADVLIQVQARVTRQTPAGLSVRILAEAMNTRGADSLARAAVDMDPPLNKTRLNTYTRFLARKLMDGMANTWTMPLAPSRNAPANPAPNAAPPAQTAPPTIPSEEKGGLGPRLAPVNPAAPQQ